jgi:hypothetical protein
MGTGVAGTRGFKVQHTILRIDDQRHNLRADIGHDFALRVAGDDFEMGQVGLVQVGEAQLRDRFRFESSIHSSLTSHEMSRVKVDAFKHRLGTV